MHLLIFPDYWLCLHREITVLVLLFRMRFHPAELFVLFFRLRWRYRTASLGLLLFLLIFWKGLFFLSYLLALILLFLLFGFLPAFFVVQCIIGPELPVLFYGFFLTWIFVSLVLVLVSLVLVLVSLVSFILLIKFELLPFHSKFCQFFFIRIVIFGARWLIKIKLSKIPDFRFVLFR